MEPLESRPTWDRILVLVDNRKEMYTSMQARQTGFNPNDTRSIADVVAQSLVLYLSIPFSLGMNPTHPVEVVVLSGEESPRSMTVTKPPSVPDMQKLFSSVETQRPRALAAALIESVSKITASFPKGKDSQGIFGPRLKVVTFTFDDIEPDVQVDPFIYAESESYKWDLRTSVVDALSICSHNFRRLDMEFVKFMVKENGSTTRWNKDVWPHELAPRTWFSLRHAPLVALTLACVNMVQSHFGLNAATLKIDGLDHKPVRLFYSCECKNQKYLDRREQRSLPIFRLDHYQDRTIELTSTKMVKPEDLQRAECKHKAMFLDKLPAEAQSQFEWHCTASNGNNFTHLFQRRAGAYIGDLYCFNHQSPLKEILLPVKKDEDDPFYFLEGYANAKKLVEPFKRLQVPLPLREEEILDMLKSLRVLGFLVADDAADLFPNEEDATKRIVLREQMLSSLRTIVSSNSYRSDNHKRIATDYEKLDAYAQVKLPKEPRDLQHFRQNGKHQAPSVTRSHHVSAEDKPVLDRKAEEKRKISYLRVQVREADAKSYAEWKRNQEGPQDSLWEWYMQNKKSLMTGELQAKVLNRGEMSGRVEGMNLDDTKRPKEFVGRLLPIAFD
ncbi:hypothetical protein HDU97_003958 [Phlyctochytrium planicorne]|nr:hypothetical protein HDU97_003958 [Phlyctochytrium planicorne]